MNSEIKNKIEDFFRLAIDHRDKHRCGGYPYLDYAKLFEIVEKGQYKKILEVGTGIGFSALVMHLAGADMVDTIDRNKEHIDFFKNYLESEGIADEVNPVKGKAHIVLKDFKTDEYDMVFFDGYAPQITQGVEFLRMLKKDGLLVSANSHLEGAYKKEYIDFLKDTDKWTFVESFNDTIIYKKV